MISDLMIFVNITIIINKKLFSDAFCELLLEVIFRGIRGCVEAAGGLKIELKLLKIICFNWSQKLIVTAFLFDIIPFGS